MKYLNVGLLIVTMFFFSINNSFAQEIKKYDFLEVIVIQKMNNSGKIKRIKVEDQESLKGKVVTIKKMEAISGTSELLNYMNTHNWELVDRKAITEGNNPIWMSYIFKKQK